MLTFDFWELAEEYQCAEPRNPMVCVWAAEERIAWTEQEVCMEQYGLQSLSDIVTTLGSGQNSHNIQ